MTTLRADGATAPGEPVLIGPYRPVERIGEGGMGVVHLALDPQGRAVALKVLRDHVCADPEARARLRREVETLRRVRTPLVAEVLDADLDGDRPYLVTRFVPARTLEERVRAEGPLAAPDVARLGATLAHALTVIHSAGVVHRDVKPANVVLLDDTPVLIDFGIAHLVDESRITRAGLVMGTPGYLAPEIVGGWPVTDATDWWGWGCTLAFAASGRPPFGSGPLEVILDRVRNGRVDLAGVDPRLVPVLAAALAVEPQHRPPAGALVAMLEQVAARPPRPDAGRAAPSPALPPPQVPATRRQPPPTVRPPRRDHPQLAPPADPDPDIAAPQNVDTGWTTPVLVATLAALAGAAALAPGATLVAFVVLTALARTVDRTMTGLLLRRREYGRRPSDGVVAVLALPWRLVMSGLTSVGAALLPTLVGLATAFIVASAVSGGGQPMRPGTGPALACAAVAAGMVAWCGPGGGSLRRGSRALARGVTPTRGAAAAVVAVLVAVALAALAARASGAGPDLTPLPPASFPIWY
jgi:hypothetical protein